MTSPIPTSDDSGSRQAERTSGCCSSRVARPIVAGSALLVCLYVLLCMRAYEVPSASMEPTLRHADRIVVVLFRGTTAGPRRGDVVVLRHATEDGESELLVKRVVGVAGDRIRIRGGSLYRNGERVDEPYVPEPMVDLWPSPIMYRGAGPTRGPSQWPDPEGVAVPEGHVFLLGDNRNFSEDSRDWGPVAISDLLGRVIGIYWPADRIGRVR